MRTRMVMQYVIDRTRGGRKETPASFRGHEHANRVRAAEVMRAERRPRQAVPATGETDGLPGAAAAGTATPTRTRSAPTSSRSSSSRAARRTARCGEVPFSAADPLNTPRDLNETDPRVQSRR